MRSKLLKGIAMVLCAVMLAVPVADSYTLTAQASDLPFMGNAGTYLDKIVDMALSKSGIVANDDIIGSVKADFVSFMQEHGDGFIDYCVNNSITEITADAWKAYVETLSLADYEKNFCIANAEFIALVYKPYEEGIENIVISNEEALQALGIADATYGKQYTLPSVAVNFMRNLFKNREAEYAPYIMIPTYKPEDIPISYFPNNDVRNNFITACSTMTGNDVFYITYYGCNYSGSGRTFTAWYPEYIPSVLGFVKGSKSTSYTYTYCLTAYDTDWSVADHYYKGDYSTLNYTTVEDYKKNCSVANWENIILTPNQYYTSDTRIYLCIVTNDGRNMPLFNNLDALKNYDAGKAPYYFTTTYNNWDSSTDNSITYTGDYLIDNSSERSYTTINSSEDYSQTNIDNSVTNITNNYIYTNPNPPGEDEESGDSGESDGGLTLGDALNTWVTAIKEFITFALNLLGEAVALISGFLNDALTILTGLTDSFSGFTGLLAGMFSFLPQEVIDALSAGIILIIVLGVIKGLKG